jgi:hypothetical protein
VDYILDLASLLLLPLGIAAAGAYTTTRVTLLQNRARSYEVEQIRADGREKRQDDEYTAALQARAEVIEGIVNAFAEFMDSDSQSNLRSLVSVRGALIKLSTRCEAAHLATSCIRYVIDAQRSPHPESVGSAFSYIQGQLEGWHVGHLSVEHVDKQVRAAHQEELDCLARHDIQPAEAIYG